MKNILGWIKAKLNIRFVMRRCRSCVYWKIHKFREYETVNGYCFGIHNTDRFPMMYFMDESGIINDKIMVYTREDFCCNKYVLKR